MYEIRYIHKNESIEKPLYVAGSDDYCLSAGKLHIGVGISGNLEITIPVSNPASDDIQMLTDEIIFYRDNIELWRGRPISKEQSFDLQNTITCEGCLSYFYDTFYPPYNHKGSVSGFLSSIVQNHNRNVDWQHRFQLGRITVQDPNDYISRSCKNYSRSLSVLKEKLQESTLGGFLRVRVNNGTKFLDYIAEYGTDASQPAQYGYNILDVAASVEYNDLITALLPLGETLEESGIIVDDGEDDTFGGARLTVESVNNGSPYIYDAKAVEKYGWICGVEEWDDVTLPENLLKKGKDYLKEHLSVIRSFKVNAVDMNLADKSTKSWNVGDKIHILSAPHGIDMDAVLTELEIDVVNIENNVLTFGNTATLTEQLNRNPTSHIESVINAEISSRRTAYDRLQKTINEAPGFYITSDVDSNRATTYYMHDAKVLAQSTFVTKVNSQGIGMSVDGGSTYPFGFTVTCAMVMDIIQANGIDAKYITLEGLKTTNSNFEVLADGSIRCKNSTIEGRVEATSGYIGSADNGWKLSENCLRHLLKSNAEGLDIYYDTFVQAPDGVNTTNAFAVRQTGTTPTSGTGSKDWVWSSNAQWFYRFQVNYKGDFAFRSVDSYYGNGMVKEYSQLSMVNGVFENTAFYRDANGNNSYPPSNASSMRITGFRCSNFYVPGSSVRCYTEYCADGIYYRGKSFIYFTDTSTGGPSNLITFNADINIGTGSIRATNDETCTICDCTEAGNMYFGASGDYKDESAKTVLRGKSIRIYSHNSGAVYLGSSGSTAVTADENLKDVLEIDKRYETFFENLTPVAYRYKHNGHRVHLGYGARAVEKALLAAGLSTEDFAGILIDHDVTIGADEAQTETPQHYDSLYSLRYEEFGALYAYMLKKALKRISWLENRVEELS